MVENKQRIELPLVAFVWFDWIVHDFWHDADMDILNTGMRINTNQKYLVGILGKLVNIVVQHMIVLYGKC